VLSILESAFSTTLPAAPPIQLSVSADGQQWYAWRRTITGWCFAIAASGTPADEVRLDGRDPPTGFLDSDESWASQSPEGSVNWHLDE